MSSLDDDELHRTLNMGVGMVVVAARNDVEAVRKAIDEDTWIIGEITEGPCEVRLV